MFQKRGRCGRCQQVVDFGFVHVAEYEARDILPPQRRAGLSMSVRAFTGDDEGPTVTAFGTALCPLCHRPSFFLFNTKEKYLKNIRESLGTSDSLFGGGSLIEVFEALPQPAKPEIDPHWPAEIHEYFRDAQALLAEGRSPAIIITTCRSVLEMSVRRLGASGRDLRGRIDHLREMGQITQGIAEWAHATRLAGNEAVHELGGTAAEAKELVEFVRQFLDVAFTLPATIAARKAETANPVAPPGA